MVLTAGVLCVAEVVVLTAGVLCVAEVVVLTGVVEVVVAFIPVKPVP